MYCNALFLMTEYTTVHMPEFWLSIGQIDVCSFFRVLLMIQGLDKFTVVGGIGRSNTCINMILLVIK